MNSDNMSNNTEESEGHSLTEKQVASSVKYLNSAFSVACDRYRDSHKEQKIQTFVLRDKKSQIPVRDEKIDYTLYDAEIEFCYLIDEIQRGPRAFAANHIKECNGLIDSISI